MISSRWAVNRWADYNGCGKSIGEALMGDSKGDLSFNKIKQLLGSDPFVPFTLRSGNKDIEVTHPHAIAFHPEVPFVTVYDNTEIYELPLSRVAFVQRQHVH
jgi:hypothetical protein